DLIVTGVQTCALPIYCRTSIRTNLEHPRILPASRLSLHNPPRSFRHYHRKTTPSHPTTSPQPRTTHQMATSSTNPPLGPRYGLRSEERRVGNERRSTL